MKKQFTTQKSIAECKKLWQNLNTDTSVFKNCRYYIKTITSRAGEKILTVRPQISRHALIGEGAGYNLHMRFRPYLPEITVFAKPRARFLT